MKKSLFRWHAVAENFKLLLICILVFILGVFIAFWAFFPVDAVQQRMVHEISRESGIKMRGDRPSMLMPLGVKMDLTIYPDIPELADIDVTDLRITPAWMSLLTSNQALLLKGNVAGGRIDSRIGSNSDVNVQLREVMLLLLQQGDLPYRLRGSLSGQLQGEQLAAGVNGAQGTFTLDVQQAAILGLDQIGLGADMPLGQLQVSGRFGERRLNLEQVVVSGGALDLSGNGTVLMGGTPAQTRLNLNVRLQPTQQTPEGVRDLLMLTGVRPGADGSYQLQIGGTLARPVMR